MTADLAPSPVWRVDAASRAEGRTDAEPVVTVYTVGTACPQCALTEQVMTRAGIPFTDVDLTDDANRAAREYVTDDLGYTRAPVVVVDEHDHWSGFRPDLITRLAARLGARP